MAEQKSDGRDVKTIGKHTFQGVLRDLNFGELFVGNYVPENLDHLFISVQTMNLQKLYENPVRLTLRLEKFGD